jgi:hypothetical protein
MGKRADRRQAQEAEYAAQVAMSEARPNEPDAILEAADACPARLGRHNYTMRGPDGLLRCWYCSRRRPAR